MAELVIRQAEERDIAAIETLEQQCFAVPWTYESLYHDVMHNKLAFYIVAEADGVLCGYVGIWKIVDEGHITNVAVAPDYRRQAYRARDAGGLDRDLRTERDHKLYAGGARRQRGCAEAV